MKSINNKINESKQIEYRVSLIDVKDENDLPISISILVENKDVENFEKWLNDQEDNIFAHAAGGNVEY